MEGKEERKKEIIKKLIRETNINNVWFNRNYDSGVNFYFIKNTEKGGDLGYIKLGGGGEPLEFNIWENIHRKFYRDSFNKLAIFTSFNSIKREMIMNFILDKFHEFYGR